MRVMLVVQYDMYRKRNCRSTIEAAIKGITPMGMRHEPKLNIFLGHPVVINEDDSLLLAARLWRRPNSGDVSLQVPPRTSARRTGSLLIHVGRYL